MAAAAGPVLGTRVLGRATLERQGLLRRAPGGVHATLERLVGLQGQVPQVPYTALWDRLEGFDPEELSAAMADRSVVRATLMRGTLHTVTSEDALGLAPLMAPVLARAFGSTAWGQRLRGVDLEPVLAAARELVEERPRTRAALGQALGERFPELDGGSVAYAFSYLVSTVQPPPRGLWRRSGPAALTTTESWLGQAPAPMPAQTLVRRYLGAFGPATVMDVQAWCGLTRLREVTDGMDLRRYRTRDGAELLDLPDAALPDPDVPAPVRLLPEYDNALLGYADRSRVGAGRAVRWPEHGPGGAIGTVLVDGLAAGTWVLRRQPLKLQVTPLFPLAAPERDEMTGEGVALAAFLRPGREVAVEVR
ncbi:winged helix DNA-binding domain-containing protein [Georgenia sp. AZ-5]|uniref:winged helix DNA-binding domain-containing protein n=1 Tax=Georgenia sp. AZ-5 TaxID=3367526 RepID=UPI003754D608